MIQPHGGLLVQQFINNYNENLTKLKIDVDEIHDVINIATGAYSPLNGFMKKMEVDSVIKHMKLTNNLIWSIPITLHINEVQKKTLGESKNILLVDKLDNPIAEMRGIEIFEYDKTTRSESVFGTIDKGHAGVNELFSSGELCVGGEIRLIEGSKGLVENNKYYRTPFETRNMFHIKDRQNIVAFQTRNPPHRGHEYIQRCSLELMDGLFIQPVVGKKKSGDFKDEYIIGAYEILIDKYFPANKVMLGILPIKMRYAGPKEAILHAIIRQNFGCTHMIIGRDHAGVGNYYGSYDAQLIFDQIGKNDLGIQIMKFENASYCNVCDQVVGDKTKPGISDNSTHISGTKFRKMIENHEPIPKEFMRIEVSEFLQNSNNQFYL